MLAVERNKVVATLLRDGLFRIGAEHPDVFGRIHLIMSDGRHMLRRIAHGSAEQGEDDLPQQMQDFLHPDVVYLDPMFPDEGELGKDPPRMTQADEGACCALGGGRRGPGRVVRLGDGRARSGGWW